MGAMSQYLADMSINAALRGQSFTVPTTVYLALYTSSPGDSDAGTEVSGGSYARQAITFGAPTQEGGKSTIKNSADITFPEATLDWGLITYIGIRDALTAGHLLYYGELTDPVPIEVGDQFIMATNDLVVQQD